MYDDEHLLTHVLGVRIVDAEAAQGSPHVGSMCLEYLSKSRNFAGACVDGRWLGGELRRVDFRVDESEWLHGEKII